jgi:NAD(P)-dependent dehydrogenase (short-subunit alcohol dehydrogenase family)
MNTWVEPLTGTTGDRLHGRVSLVFGGGEDPTSTSATSTSNGAAIARRLVADGSSVVVTDLLLERAAATVAAVDGPALALAADAADPGSCRRAVEDALVQFGKLDVVVCNVGILDRRAIRDETVENWDRTFAVNVRSHFLVAQAALPHMLARGSGCFIFVTSTSALRSSGTSLAYEASKAAQLAIARHIAVRYCDRGIRANALVLGAIDTPMAARLFGGDRADVERRDGLCLMGRQGRAEEVAAAAAFLASDDASYTTGTELLVDGGITAASYAYRPSRRAGRMGKGDTDG